MEIEKSLLGKRQSNNDYRQESTMDVKISRWKYEKQGICLVSKCISQQIINYKDKK